ncbi:hypothetical protein BX661DRAFT_177648 [Kickxella alabastrina]|uniref:uncharacterized protein n=1 Tax=Kickxella alabastrina TaxID=61397 RepID=UPI0022210612|nr:uncharacterized protein BX661DRAFT_177648 [Kickxella alabastrina]KAI7833836.1 hypothetical protein BX661DRAFT_177648 [Kickxella alabastrina]
MKDTRDDESVEIKSTPSSGYHKRHRAKTGHYIQQKFLAGNYNDITRVCVVLSTAIPRRPLSEIHHSILGLAMALSFSTLFMSLFKQMSDVLASDFLDRCKLSQEDFDRAYQTGVALSYKDCQNKNIKGDLHMYPVPLVSVISSCAMGYLSLFISIQLGLRLHPQVRRQLREIAPDDAISRSRPGQTLISFITLLPFAAGGGHGWGYAVGSLTGLAFAYWAHLLYCSDMAIAVILPPYS